MALELLKSAGRAVLPARVYGPLRARRVRRQIERYRARTVEHDYAGFRLQVRLEDPLAEGWYDHDWGVQPELEALRDGRLRPGARVLDVGAHQGVVALILARMVGAGGHVVAVEAEGHNAAVARRNAQANGAANLEVVHAAGAAHNGVVSFTEGLNGIVARRGAAGSVEVPAVTVDELARRHGRPDVVLIDVEGHEAHVLAGATATVAAGATDFLVELHEGELLAAAGSTADDVLAHFPATAFDVAIALADERAGALTADSWRGPSAGLHREGRRCFVLARARVIPAGSAPSAARPATRRVAAT